MAVTFVICDFVLTYVTWSCAFSCSLSSAGYKTHAACLCLGSLSW